MIVTETGERTYSLVGVEDLFADDRYQRPVIKAEVDLIASDFDIRVFGVLLVSVREDGSHAIIDGQQRLEAGKIVGMGELPCELLFDLSLRDEATLYVKVNKNRKRLQPLDIFKAEVISGNPVALKAKKILEDNGFHASKHGRDRSWSGIASLQNMMRKRGACAGVVASRMAVEVAAGWRDRGALRAQDADVFRGIAQFGLHHWGEFDLEVFKECMWNTMTPTSIMERTHVIAHTPRGGTHVAGQYMVIAKAYNRCVGRRKAVAIKEAKPSKGEV